MKNDILQNRENHDFRENYNFGKYYILYILLDTLFTTRCCIPMYIKIHGGKHYFYTMYVNITLLLFTKSVIESWLTFCNIWWSHDLNWDRVCSWTLKFTEEILMWTYFTQSRHDTFYQKCHEFWSKLVEIHQNLVKMMPLPPANPGCTSRAHINLRKKH